MPSFKFLFLLLGSVLTLSAQHPEGASPADSLGGRKYTDRLLLEGVITSAPLVGIGLLQSLQNEHVRELRFGYYPHFRRHFDDYLQFAPLAAQVGLRLGGVEGTSRSVWQTLSADLIASASMMALTSAIKYTARVERPDGSTRNSFPSGHTAMAFTSATLLAEEYGQRYPWVTVAGYAAASAVGVGRMLNNRHWIGDVVTGAGLGLLSGHIGYWLADRAFGGSRRQLHTPMDYPSAPFQLYFPIKISTTRSVGEGGWSLRGRQVGIGLHYTPKAWPVYLLAETHMGLYQALPSQEGVIPGTPESRAITFCLGAGREQRLWQEFMLQGSCYGIFAYGVRGSEDYPLPGAVRLLGPRSGWGMGLELAPTWRLTKRIGLRLPLAVQYFPASLRLEGGALSPLSLSSCYYSAGTALTLYL